MTKNNEFDKVLNKAKELEKLNFKDIENFDYNSYYEAIAKIANKNNNLKQEEAENIVSNQASVVINEDFVKELNLKKEQIHNFIRKYDPNSEIINNMKVHDVDKIYSIFNYLLNSYINDLNEMEFNFTLTNGEFKFLNKILTNTLEYDGDEVFNYTEFIESFWDEAKKIFEQDKSKAEYVFKINIKKILLLHHLIKGHKVKGITLEFKLFRNILYKIAQTNRVFNAYNIIAERLKDDGKLWGSSLDAVLEPKEKSEGLEKTEETKILEVTKEDMGK